jgi:hypothetical protein
MPALDRQLPRAARSPRRSSFIVSSDETCSVSVTTCSSNCADFSTARYRLDVTGSDLVLVQDDVASSSPDGAFVGAPLRRGK